MRRIILILLGLIILLGDVVCQPPLSTKSKRAAKLYRDALEQLNLLYYDQALYFLNDALQEDPNFVDVYLLMGEIYTDKQEDSLAILCFNKSLTINPNYFPPVYSNLANLEYNNGKYKEAAEHLKKYLLYPSENKKFRKSAEYQLKNCDFAIELIKKPVPFNPRNLGPNINNQFDQYWPSLSADEQTIVFTQLLPINPNNPQVIRNRQEDFYISTFQDSAWKLSRPLGPPLNTSNNEGAQAISADGKIMVFTGCNRKDGYGGCDLYISYQNEGIWTVPKNIGGLVNTNAKETQPSITADGKKIYFSSNREGTKGGLDLWMTQVSDSGKWSAPINLGDSINTEYDEQSPFIHTDNRTLYFSSKGWPGLGRYDLFIAHKKNDTTWTTPVNLGYPINTCYSEEGLVVGAKGKTAYFSSTRAGFGGRDIFSFDLYPEIQPTPVSYMKGMVYDSETKLPLKARFELIDLGSSETVMDSYSDKDGSFLICLPSGKDYALNVNKKGYLFYSDNFTMSHGDYLQPFLKDVPLDPIKVGGKVVMKNIFFDHDSYVLKPESKIEINRLINLLKEIPTLKVEISGHTNDYGTVEYNQKLSENRAKAVAAYIIERGINSKKITWKGYGKTQPLVKNDTDDHRALNRRTEFKVIEL